MKISTAVVLALGLLTVLLVFSFIADTSEAVVLFLPLLPGFLLYVITTGDIHGWQPGPIGQMGRIFVTGIGAWLFWAPIFYLVLKRRARKRKSQ